jgi:hypothetical protein
MGVVPLHWAVLPAEHWPHAPVGWQAGVAPPHSPSPAQARHVCAAVLHTGVVPPHWAFVLQLTHVPVATLHAGIAVEHCDRFVAEQTPQAPPGWQAGVAPLQSVSPPHARQVCVAVLHTGVVPPHWAFDVHGTQAPAATLHTGVAPVHLVPFPAEHWPQAPPGWQAGVAAPHSLSPVQARQVWNAGSQTGVAPEQSASARHLTQVPVVV